MSYPQLMQAYRVLTHDGDEKSIQAWLQPDQVPVLENDPLGAIRQGFSFDLNRVTPEVAKQLPPGTLESFAKYPMRKAFGVDPWDLLIGYLRSPNPQEYFQRITGEPSQSFLNRAERVFYLTRGYGLPNPNISPEDLRIRKILMEASPTALIALSDLLKICPTRQDPELILDRLGDLRTIDKFHLNTIQSVTACLGQNRLCSATSCEPDQVKCFEKFLQERGILPIFEYDPHFNLFVSNLSQLNLYERVIPTKVWNREEVQEMSPIYVRSILSQLPDWELLKIIPRHPLTVLKDRLRGTLLKNSVVALLKPSWVRDDETIIFGREIEPKRSYTLDQLLKSFQENKGMIDPLGNALDYESALSLRDPRVNEWVYITQAAELETKAAPQFSENLMMWDHWSYPDRWISVARRISDEPIPADLLETTLEYYRQVFPGKS